MRLSFEPSKVSIDNLVATYVVRVVRIHKGKVTISVGGREYTLEAGDTFNFDLRLS